MLGTFSPSNKSLPKLERASDALFPAATMQRKPSALAGLGDPLLARDVDNAHEIVAAHRVKVVPGRDKNKEQGKI